MGLRRIEWVILGVEDSTNLGIARGFCILAGLYLASMMDGTSIETPSAAVGYVFVSGFSAGADSTRDFRGYESAGDHAETALNKTVSGCCGCVQMGWYDR